MVEGQVVVNWLGEVRTTGVVQVGVTPIMGLVRKKTLTVSSLTIGRLLLAIFRVDSIFLVATLISAKLSGSPRRLRGVGCYKGVWLCLNLLIQAVILLFSSLALKEIISHNVTGEAKVSYSLLFS